MSKKNRAFSTVHSMPISHIEISDIDVAHIALYAVAARRGTNVGALLRRAIALALVNGVAQAHGAKMSRRTEVAIGAEILAVKAAETATDAMEAFFGQLFDHLPANPADDALLDVIIEEGRRSLAGHESGD